MLIRKSTSAILALFAAASASATVSVTSGSFSYSQNFNSLATASASPVTASWTNDSTIVGWSLFLSNLTAPTTYRAELGNQDVGSFTSYGADSSTDRALGGISGPNNAYFGSPAAGAVSGYIAVAFTNNAGSALNSFTLGFSGEEWRYSSAGAQAMVLEYGFGATFASVATWSAPGGLFDWTSPQFGGAGLGGIDGNGIGRVSGRGGSVPVTWAAGQTLWIRWIERNDVGANHGLAIDDLTFTVTAVPEPSSYFLLLAGIAAVGSVIRARK